MFKVLFKKKKEKKKRGEALGPEAWGRPLGFF